MIIYSFYFIKIKHYLIFVNNVFIKIIVCLKTSNNSILIVKLFLLKYYSFYKDKIIKFIFFYILNENNKVYFIFFKDFILIFFFLKFWSRI